MTKKMDHFIAYFILLFPFIDFLTGILTWNQIDYSIGLIIKGIFLLFIIIYLLKNYKSKKIFLFMGIYFIIYFLYILTEHKNLVIEVTNIIKIYYLPILILFFSNYENKKLTKKTIVYILFFYLILYLTPALFGLGHNISEVYANKNLYLSFFYIGNELINIFIVLLPIVILYLIESNSYLLKGLFVFLICIASLFLGTKAYYASVGIIILYFLIKYRKKIMVFVKKNQLKTGLCIIVILAGIVVYLPKMDLIANIKTSLNHYEVDSVGELFTIKNIDHIIFSNRLTFLKNMNQNYIESKNLEKLLGMGREKINRNKDVEIDCFDIFYSVGIVGFTFYLLFFIYVLKQTKLKSVYKLSFILIIILSCFSGHVLLSPMVTTYIGLLFLVSKNDQGKIKKDILLVSNMYPSKNYPHYGIFVKHTYELLVKHNLNIDLVVIKKTNHKFLKLYQYIKFYLVSFWKSVWNNYDYIYVHFISHSSLGIILPFICSKNTKLVLNVHGNDIVADYDFEVKNEKRSAKYLKFADRVISPSKYFESILIKKYKVNKNKIVVYPSGGVNSSQFQKMDKKTALQNLGLKENIKYFGFVARIEKDKGYDTLIEAIHELKTKKKLKDIQFILVGSGLEESILNEMIEKYELSSYIIRKPLLSQEELVYVYNAVEAFIYPTRRKSESLGLTGLEAMACETLVIGSNQFGPSDYLIDEENSLTFDPYDYKELVKKIEVVLSMKVKEKNKIKKAARNTSEEYSSKKTESIILDVFMKKNQK